MARGLVARGGAGLGRKQQGQGGWVGSWAGGLPLFRGSSRGGRTAPRRTAGATRAATALWVGGAWCGRYDAVRSEGGRAMAFMGAGGLGTAGLGANWFVPITWAEAAGTRDRLT